MTRLSVVTDTFSHGRLRLQSYTGSLDTIEAREFKTRVFFNSSMDVGVLKPLRARLLIFVVVIV